MPEGSKLEEVAKTAPQQEKEEEQKPKPVGTLESVVNESIHLGKTLFNLGFAGLIPTTQAYLGPRYTRDTAILAGAQIAADATTNFKKGKKTTAGEITKSSAVGTFTTIPVYHMFDLVNKIPTESPLGYITKASAWGGLAYPPYLGIYQFVDYVIKNMSFKGVGAYLKENYWQTLKNLWKRILPISLLNIFFMPPSIQVPISALLSYAFALFGAPKKEEIKEEEKRDKTPYLVAVSNVIGKLGYKSFFLPLNTTYALGSGVRNWYDSFIKPPITAPAIQKASALQPA